MAASGLPEFRDLPGLIAEHACARPEAIALRCSEHALSYGQLDTRMDQVAAALQRDGLQATQCIAICASASIDYLAVFCGALRAGVAVAPLAPGSTAQQLLDMLANAEARLLFADEAALQTLHAGGIDAARLPPVLRLDDGFDGWLGPPARRPRSVDIAPDWPFNVIYSSGTTGTPKGIVQSHAMRWAHIQRAAVTGYASDSVTLVATPPYSNTTLVAVFPTLGVGGCVVLLPKFDAAAYLQIAERHRATHTMLVPVQYQRLMDYTEFDRHDLSSFRMKLCTSAPFRAALKAEVLSRWPGGLIEYYGMTEGGGTCILRAHERPDKLHTVGQPAEGHDIRLIDEQGREVPADQAGEVVGRSAAMMNGYHRQPEKTAEVEWTSPEGLRFIRTGDVGRFDADGFLTLLDRRKDMIISGGFSSGSSKAER